MTRVLLQLILVMLAVGISPRGASAQALFSSEAPVELTLTTNLRDMLRERDSTALRWFGAAMTYTDAGGAVRSMPTELRARGHFRRQARNCGFPPLFIRAEKSVRDSSILQGNPRLKIVTPCRPAQVDYQQYILIEYLMYRTYSVIQDVHHRTRLANITYKDSTNRVAPIVVTAFLLEVGEEVADQHKLQFAETPGALFDDVDATTLDRLSLFEYWIGNTDWSLSALHNVEMLRDSLGIYTPVAYDFDWSGAVNARYSFPNATLGIRTVRERLHRGPCRTAEQWAPTLVHYRAKRAAIDSIWALPLAGLDPKVRADTKGYLDQLWPILDNPRQFGRAVVDICQKLGN